MKLLSFEYCMKYKINTRYSNSNIFMNIGDKRIIKLRLQSLRPGLSKDGKLIFLALISPELSSSVDILLKYLGYKFKDISQVF